jgi:hypothetical protein
LVVFFSGRNPYKAVTTRDEQKTLETIASVKILQREVIAVANGQRFETCDPFPIDQQSGTTFDTFINSNKLQKSISKFHMRHFNILVIESDIQNVEDFLIWLATKLDSTTHHEALSVKKCENRKFVIMYIKNNQRKDNVVEGLLERYILPRCNRHAVDAQIARLCLDFANLEGYGLSMVMPQKLDDNSVFDLLGTCRSLSREQLLFLKLQAIMTKPKELSPLQRALTRGWSDIHELLKDRISDGALDTWFTLEYPHVIGLCLEDVNIQLVSTKIHPCSTLIQLKCMGIQPSSTL